MGSVQAREKKIARAERKLLDAAEKYAAYLKEQTLSEPSGRILAGQLLKEHFLSSASVLEKLRKQGKTQ